ncbi:hypothetical protein [Aliivibrio logei]|uniref:hypothetical protein n=1 Tax=Aliivibrio logei TaxID=688 RepID=UPI0035C90E94
MKKLSVSFLFATLLVSCSTFSYEANIDTVKFKQGMILLSFSDGKTQQLKSEVEPDFLDYTYTLLDVNFDGIEDLIVTEQNGKNSLSIVYTYNQHLAQVNELIYFEITGLRVNSDKKYICGTNQLSREDTQLVYKYSESNSEVFNFNYVSNKGYSLIHNDKKEIDDKTFSQMLDQCVTSKSVQS